MNQGMIDGLINGSINLMSVCQRAGLRHLISIIWQASDK